jgi:hypothetical protein
MKENKRLEIIKEVYGDKYKQYSPNNDGWARFSGRRYSVWHCDECEYKEWLGHHFYRPKSLSGIEDNNGWIRTDEDFPKKSGIYIFLVKDIEHQVRLQFPLSKEEENHYRNDFTHFRVPKHHPLPIY